MLKFPKNLETWTCQFRRFSDDAILCKGFGRYGWARLGLQEKNFGLGLDRLDVDGLLYKYTKETSHFKRMKDSEAKYQKIATELKSLLAGHSVYNVSDFKFLKDRAHRCFKEELSEHTWNIRLQSSDIYYASAPSWNRFSGYISKVEKNKDLDSNQKQPLLETARKWEAIAQLIEKATPLIVKGRKISERKTPLRTLENTGTCAVCGQNVKLNKGGKIVNHGHTVEYHQHNGWCMGQYKFPWEVSPEGAIYYVEKYLLPEKSRIESKLEILVWSPLILSGLEKDLRATVGEISTLERRIAKWEKQELPGSLSPTLKSGDELTGNWDNWECFDLEQQLECSGIDLDLSDED